MALLKQVVDNLPAVEIARAVASKKSIGEAVVDVITPTPVRKIVDAVASNGSIGEAIVDAAVAYNQDMGQAIVTVVLASISSIDSTLPLARVVLASIGKVHNTLQSDNPALYKRMCESSQLVLQHVFYCKRTLGVADSKEEGVVNHDYLVLHLLMSDCTTASSTHNYILAEKSFDGIHIHWCVDGTFAPSTTLDCYHSTFMRLPRIENVLADFTPSYDLTTSNCKHYARSVAEKLIDGAISDPKKRQCQKNKIHAIVIL